MYLFVLPSKKKNVEAQKTLLRKRQKESRKLFTATPILTGCVFWDAVVYLSLLRRSVVEEWQIQRQKVLVTWVVTPTRLHSVKRVSFCLCYTYTYIFWLTCTYTNTHCDVFTNSKPLSPSSYIAYHHHHCWLLWFPIPPTPPSKWPPLVNMSWLTKHPVVSHSVLLISTHSSQGVLCLWICVIICCRVSSEFGQKIQRIKCQLAALELTSSWRWLRTALAQE